MNLTRQSPDGNLSPASVCHSADTPHDGARTRVGAGDGLLSGVEHYTLRNPAEAASSVTDWDFTRYQPGGTYGAREWPVGSWEAGTWNLTLFNDDVSALENGVVAAVTITGVTIPEPLTGGLFATGMLSLILCRRRNKVEQGGAQYRVLATKRCD